MMGSSQDTVNLHGKTSRAFSLWLEVLLTVIVIAMFLALSWAYHFSLAWPRLMCRPRSWMLT